MQELEKILEEIDNLKSECLNGEYEPAYGAGALDMANAIKDIIRSLSRENDSEITRSSRDSICGECSIEKAMRTGRKVMTAGFRWRRGCQFQTKKYGVTVKRNGNVSTSTDGMTEKGHFWNYDKENILAWKEKDLIPEPYRPERSE